ncbi:hypothetical protein, partial [Paenibacillus thiaminolyticus]|uniref:hypothetical protein n=1 Tax=Paenibacillus thiaminolyticus TaxID=49283 RepID=UPI001C71D7FF
SFLAVPHLSAATFIIYHGFLLHATGKILLFKISNYPPLPPDDIRYSRRIGTGAGAMSPGLVPSI